MSDLSEEARYYKEAYERVRDENVRLDRQNESRAMQVIALWILLAIAVYFLLPG